jgi:hypothetical protein
MTTLIKPHTFIPCAFCALGGKSVLAMYVRAKPSCEAHKALLPRIGMFARTRLVNAL